MSTTPNDMQSSPNEPPEPENSEPAALPQDSSEKAIPDPLDSEARFAAMPPAVTAAAEAMLADPRLIDRITEDIAAIGVVGESRLGRILYLVGTSRLLSKPLSAIVQGLSSSGKSHLLERIGDMLLEESALRPGSRRRGGFFVRMSAASRLRMPVAYSAQHEDMEVFT